MIASQDGAGVANTELFLCKNDLGKYDKVGIVV